MPKWYMILNVERKHTNQVSGFQNENSLAFEKKNQIIKS